MSDQQLERLIHRYEPAIAAQARDVLSKLRHRMPGAVELIYDNYAGLVIGFSATEKASDAVLSVIVRRDHLTLCFLHGASLRDPQHVLRGEGKRVRHVRLQSSATLDEPLVAGFVAQSIAMSPAGFGAKKRRTLLRGAAQRANG